MKKILFLMLAVAMFACTQQKGFKVEVNLEGADGQVVMEQRVGGEWLAIDTAAIDTTTGIAVLEGEVANPGAYYISLLGQRAKALVFVENTAMTMVGKADSIYMATITGSATHSEYKVVDDKIKAISEEYMALYQESRTASAAGDTAKANALMKTVNELYESTTTLQEDFVKNNKSSFVTPYFLSRIQYGKEADELEALVAALDTTLQNVPSVVEIKEKIAKLKTVAIGQIAPDFTQNDVDGNPIKFSDIYKKNELTLVDFWASWCGPCRQENPHVVATYTKFKDKGFSVFGVSLDRDKDAWVKAIADDNLTWDHVSDLAYWNNAAAKLYAISSVPSSLLVDKNGKIIAKNKRGDELSKSVEEFFAN